MREIHHAIVRVREVPALVERMCRIAVEPGRDQA